MLPGDDGAAETAADRCLERVESPLLTGITLDAGGLDVVDLFPVGIPDLYAGQPVFVVGRHTTPGEGELVFHGTLAGGPFAVRCPVVLPEVAPARETLAPVCARARIAEIESRLIGAPETERPQLVTELTEVALAHRLVSAATSFLAIDEDSFVAGAPALVRVAVARPADKR